MNETPHNYFTLVIDCIILPAVKHSIWSICYQFIKFMSFSRTPAVAEAHEFDELIANAPDAMFDCRKYYWPNFNSPDYVTHSFSKFVYPFSLPTISLPGSYYVATFGEPLLLTWVGFEAKVDRRIGAKISFKRC